MTRLLPAFLLLLPPAWAETPPPRPTASIKLYVLDAKAEENLGKRVTFDATLAKSPLSNGRLNLLTSENKPPRNIVFNLPPKLAEAVQSAGGGIERSVFVSGVVTAPARANAPYGFDIEEIRIYNPNGELLKTVSLATLAEKKPEEPPAPPEVKAPALPTPAAPPAAAAGDDLPLPAMIAGGLAVGVGAVALTLMLRRRNRGLANRDDPPPPSTSVSDRLNRRVR